MKTASNNKPLQGKDQTAFKAALVRFFLFFFFFFFFFPWLPFRSLSIVFLQKFLEAKSYKKAVKSIEKVLG